MCYPPLYAQVVAWCSAHSGFFINIHKSHWINKIEALKTFLAECWKFHFYLVSGRDEWSFSVKTFQLDVNITAKTDLPAIPLWTRNMKRAPQGIKFQTYHQYGPLGNILEFPHFLIALFITVILSVSHIGGSSQQAMLSPEPTLISSFQPLSPVWLFVTPWHARPHCPWPTPRVYSNSCPLSRWCHPTISSSVIPFSFCFQSFPASGSFQMSQLFASGGQRIGLLASTSVLPMNIQDGFPLGWTCWISLQSQGLSRVFSNTIVQKHQFLGAQLPL